MVVAALIGGLVSYVGAMLQKVLQTRRRIEEALWDKRERVYRSAWRQTGLLPLRPRTEVVTYGQLTELSAGLTRWYYEEGGLYLSGGSRRAYSAAMDALEALRVRGEPSAEVSDSDYEEARKACSTLRSWLAKDLFSRKATPYFVRKPRFPASEGREEAERRRPDDEPADDGERATDSGEC